MSDPYKNSSLTQSIMGKAVDGVSSVQPTNAQITQANMDSYLNWNSVDNFNPKRANSALYDEITPAVKQTPIYDPTVAAGAAVPEEKGLFGGIADSIGNFIGGNTRNADGSISTTGLGGMKGVADLGGGLASLYSIHDRMEHNKRMNEAFNLQKIDRERQYAANARREEAINRMGGVSSAPLAK